MFILYDFFVGLLACNISSIEIVALSDDTKAHVKINDGKGGSVIQLNVGHTSISIEITSANGSNTQVLVITASFTYSSVYYVIYFYFCSRAM